MNRSLYQKYRPQQFSEVREQPEVVAILERAVQDKAAAHAYLFTGPRGIGKTSVARIFARALGCVGTDLFEIDAASHTSVENIRELSAGVYTQPSLSPCKVYILDEVHMLSKAAFNAFLKTLEEPPPHSVFILVTTEHERLPETVVSRCVSLRFRQPSLTILQETAIETAKQEGVTLSMQSAALIALMAEGSFRDMLTLLQKVLTIATETEMAHETVEEILGAPRTQQVHTYLTALLDSNVQEGVQALQTATTAQADIPLFVKLCLRTLRSALLVREGVAGVLDERNDAERATIEVLAKHPNLSVKPLQGLLEAIPAVQRATLKTLPLELLLIPTSETPSTSESTP